MEPIRVLRPLTVVCFLSTPTLDSEVGGRQAVAVAHWDPVCACENGTGRAFGCTEATHPCYWTSYHEILLQHCYYDTEHVAKYYMQNCKDVKTYFQLVSNLYLEWTICTHNAFPTCLVRSQEQIVLLLQFPDSIGQDPLWCMIGMHHNLCYLKTWGEGEDTQRKKEVDRA